MTNAPQKALSPVRGSRAELRSSLAVAPVVLLPVKVPISVLLVLKRQLIPNGPCIVISAPVDVSVPLPPLVAWATRTPLLRTVIGKLHPLKSSVDTGPSAVMPAPWDVIVP